MMRTLYVLLFIFGSTGLARAVSCDPEAPENYGCTPQNPSATIYSDQGRAGLRVTWIIYSPPPDIVRVYREPKVANAQGYYEVAGTVSGLFDSGVSPGTPYIYRVCAEYEVSYCSDTNLQTMPTPTRPPITVLPSNLTIREVAAWVTPTRWERRWVWDWVPGNGQNYDALLRESLDSGTNNFSQIGSLLPNGSTHYEEVMPAFANAAVTYRVCAVRKAPSGPQPEVGCTNTITVRPGALPAPKAPVKLSAFVLPNGKEVDVGFSAGDENVTAWFEVERMKGAWIVLNPRVINKGSHGELPNIVSDAAPPFTYRVCAGNSGPGRTCSEPFQAKPSRYDWFPRPRKLIGLAGKCLNVDAPAPLYQPPFKNGTLVTLYSCLALAGSTVAGQIWDQPPTATHQILASDGKCLDVAGGNVTSGTHVIVWECNGGTNQSWTFAGDGTIRGLGGKCLDVANGSSADGTQIILWDCHGGANQKWSTEYLPRLGN